MEEINVEWENGFATGFTSRAQANRFINSICIKAAPGKHYQVITVILPNI
jgi:hypothetical protein